MSLAQEARDVRRRITERLRELEPLAREYDELRRVAADMRIEPPEGNEGSDVHSAPHPGRELTALVLEAVRSEPGRTVADYAVILGLAQTVMYRPVRELTDDRMIVKRARQLFPA